MKVLIVCSARYNEHELTTTVATLIQNDIEFELTATQRIVQGEKHHLYNTVARTVYEIVSSDDFDGLMIISGHPTTTEAMWDDEHILVLVDMFNQQHKPIAAICGAVPVIRYAAKDKRVTFYPKLKSREYMTKAGAIQDKAMLCYDDNLITAEFEMAAQQWSEMFCDLLLGREVSVDVVDSGFRPFTWELKPVPEVERLKRKKND